MSADHDLEAMITTLRKIAGPDVERELATTAAPLVDAALKATAAAGTSPDGTPWPPKKDGGRPMVNAASHIQTKAYGSLLRATLTGPDVHWNFGVRGVKRQVLPDASSGEEVPAHVLEAMTKASGQVFDRLMGEAR